MRPHRRLNTVSRSGILGEAIVAYLGNPEYSHTTQDLTGILVTNLGTPDEPTPSAVRRYLREFLRDPRVIETPRALWWLILHGIILRTRPRRSAALYEEIWTREGSPLLLNSRRQAEHLQHALETRGAGSFKVALGMRYGNPSVGEALETLRRANVRRLLVLPLYPQYSATTTASTFDAVAEVLRRWRWLPALRFVDHYHDNPRYIAALAASIRDAWAQSGVSERLLFSFHGIPQNYFDEGDPYFCECQKTARLVAEALELDEDRWAVSFQSRVGWQKWLQPYTDKTLRKWGRKGIERVSVICPGFAADCLETLEEIAIQNRSTFLDAGGQAFDYIPALNDRADHINALADIVDRHAHDWLQEETRDAPVVLDQRRERAANLGASR
jgi:protoporphyrin/coproporphyrin ferrochelatase